MAVLVDPPPHSMVCLLHIICTKTSVVLNTSSPRVYHTDQVTIRRLPKRDNIQSCLVATKITIPAVKITGDVPSLPLHFDESILPPQPCLSESLKIDPIDSKIDPIDSTLFPVLEDDEPVTVLTSHENETEFGEFLLDAVDWL